MDRRIFQVHFCIRIHDSHSHHLIIHFFICINKQCMESQLLASPHTATAIPFPPRRNKPPSAAFALQAITASPPQKTRSPPTPHIPHFFPTCGNDSSTVCSITLSAKSPPFSNRTATPRYVCNDRFVTSTRNFFVCRSFISPSLSNRISICGFG